MSAPPVAVPEITRALTIEEVTDIVKNCIREQIDEDEEYSPEVMTDRTKSLTATILQRLTEAFSLCKYVINVTIIQNNGCGVHANTGAHWTEKDFFVTIPFSNAHVHVLASISSIHVTPRPDILKTNLDEKIN
eukprot:g15722.t1